MSSLIARCLCIASLNLVCVLPGNASAADSGRLYREFATHNGGDNAWRVTDERAVEKFERARAHLPNARVAIEIEDLQHAVAAEALLDRWGGHRGTINKRIRFNDGNWITVPELEGVPEGIRPEQLFFQDNPVVAVPLQDLHEGTNFFEADCDEEAGFGWGQWGLYSMVVRVYYDRDAKGEGHRISGRIEEPADSTILTENPRIRVRADAAMGVARVDVLASYQGYDEDGDGRFGGFHKSRFQRVRGQPNDLRDHVGTCWREPYEMTWDTRWIPDQAAESIRLVARIQDSRGYCTVTDSVDRLTLHRPSTQVKLYRAKGVPEDFGVRAGETKSCRFEIPAEDPIAEAIEAALHLRTWHGWDGHHEPLRINEHTMAIAGKNHFYDYDLLTFPTDAMVAGTNRFTIHSDTEHHMLEVLWPGPAIVARMPRPPVQIGSARYQGRDHFVVHTHRATYWLDKRSGGLSRLIDRDGRDWIAFKKQPWDRYPESAASAFRGLPNLLFGGDESGFGHPGWDRGSSEKIDERTILSTSESGTWRLRWTFHPDHADLRVETDDPERRFWFLYEGPVGGRWAPSQQYFATDRRPPDEKPRDYYGGDRLFDHFRWIYVGDRALARVLAIEHRTPDDAIDTFSHLGNSSQGLQSPDGMVVLGFGRGPKGIEPLLRGPQHFRIGLIESGGWSESAYRSIGQSIERWSQR